MRAMQFQAQSNSKVDPSKTREEQHDHVVRSSIVSCLMVAVPLFAAIISASYSSKNYIISSSTSGMNESGPVYTTVTVSSNVKLHDDDVMAVKVVKPNSMKSILKVLPFVVSDDSAIEENESISSRSSNDSSTTALIPHNVNDNDDDDALDITRDVIVGKVFLPALLEVGTIILFQSFGIPLISRALNLLRKGRWVRAGAARFFASSFGKMTGRIFNFCKLGYKKTNASKIVTRTKKLIKHFMHHGHGHNHHHDDDYNNHHRDEHEAEKQASHAEKVAH